MVSESRRNLVLTVVCLALVLVMAGVAMLNLALPSIARDLGASQSQQQWIIDGYTVVLAALLLWWALASRANTESRERDRPVSYTHLTLPTSDLV